MAQDYELTLRDYWTIFLKRKWTVALCFFAVLAATIFYTNLQPVLYRASAIVKIEPPTVGLNAVFPQQYFWRPSEVSEYAKQIRSAPIIEKTIKELGLAGQDASEEELFSLIQIISSRVSSNVIEKANMVEIKMVSEDSEQAAVIANKIIEVFKLENIRQKNQQVRNVRKFIEKQLADFSARLEKSEDRLRELTLKGVGVMATSLSKRITELEARRIDLLTKFTELHPDVIKIDEQIAILKEEMKNLPQEEFEFNTLTRDSLVNDRLYNLLRERLQEARIRESEKIDNVILISPAVPARYPFRPRKALNYSLAVVLGMLFGVVMSLTVEHLDTSIGTIEDLEKVTKVNVIGVIPYFIEDEERAAAKRSFFLGRKAAKLKGMDRLRSQLIATHKEGSVFMEAFRILGANTQVLFGEGGRIKGKTILITSSNPQEGKSIISANLSIIMAQMGYKTVLVDADLRRSTVHKIFGLKQKEKGLTDILTGEIAFESAMRTTTDLLLGDMDQENLIKRPWIDLLHLITSGTTFPNSPYLLNTEKMDWLLKTLRERYDVIVLDTPPILAISDASITIPKSDGALLVYRAGTTSRLALRRANMQIESVRQGWLKGIVINNVTPEIIADTYYYYRQKKYYGEGEKEKPSST